MEQFVDIMFRFMPYIGGAIATLFAWWTAKYASEKKAKNDSRSYTDDAIGLLRKTLDDERLKHNADLVLIREEIHSKDMELAQIKILIAAGLEIDPSQITIKMIQSLVTQQNENIQTLSSFISTAPMLIWIKRRISKDQYVMVKVSDVYAAKYLGKPATYYEGRYDKEIWGEKIAAAFALNDEKSYLTNQAIHILEPIKSPLTGESGWLRGIKWSFNIEGFTYICGTGVHETEKENKTVLGGNTESLSDDS